MVEEMSRLRLAIIFGSILYVLALQLIYPLVIVPVFSYSGMIYRSQEGGVLLFQCLLACLPAIWLPKSFDRPSQYQCWILYVTVVVPTCILPYHVTAMAAAQIHRFNLALVSCFVLLCLVTRVQGRRIKFPHLSSTAFLALLAATTVATYGWLLAKLGVGALFLPVDQVYELRTELRSINLPLLLNYMIWWQGVVINPIISALGFQKKRWILVLLSLLLQVQLYSITSLRTFLAAAVFQVGIGVFFIIVRRNRGVFFIYAMGSCAALAAIWHVWYPKALAPLLLLERWIFNGGQLSGYYFEFFSRHASAGLAHSSVPLLRWLFPGGYDLPVGQVIGREYFVQSSDGVYTNATAHIWADGFAAFGYSGMLWATLVAMGLLLVADHACQKQDPAFKIMAFALIAMSMINQNVLTGILTGGLAPFLLLSIIMPSWDKTKHFSR